jgi:hypothetical protein
VPRRRNGPETPGQGSDFFSRIGLDVLLFTVTPFEATLTSFGSSGSAAPVQQGIIGGGLASRCARTLSFVQNPRL